MKNLILLLLSTVSLAQTRQAQIRFGGVSTGAKKITPTTNNVPVSGSRKLQIVGDGTSTADPNSFALSSSAHVSVGIFKTDSTLLRTLWVDTVLRAGVHVVKWNGKDNQGATVPSSTSCVIGVVSHNMTATWEGVVGNTSSVSLGTGVMRAAYPINCITVPSSGTALYAGRRYNETWPSQVKIPLSNPSVKQNMPNQQFGTTGAVVHQVCSDASRVYWGDQDHRDGHTNLTYVWVTNTTNDLQATFTAGTSYTVGNGFIHPSAIDVVNVANAEITGMAVQQSGPYLFISRMGLGGGRLDVLNKTTGAISQTIAITGVRALAVDANDNLWVTSGTATAARYTVRAGGTLSAATLTLPGLVAPLAIAVSPDGGTVTVADGGNSQQVKGFSTSNGSLTWTKGQAGGYANGPDVSTDKFMFYWNRRSEAGSASGGPRDIYSGLAYQSDGSLWVIDPGNCRIIKYTSSRQYVSDLMHVPINRSIWVDANNPTRLFADFLEYQIDYSKPLQAGNDSWKLVRNYADQVPAAWSAAEYGRFRYVTTLSNGRTYALTWKSSGTFALVELLLTGVRDTGITVPDNARYFFDKDGSIRRITFYIAGQTAQWFRRPLTGFDANNNPVWGDETLVVASPVAGPGDPIDRGWIGWTVPTSTPTQTGVIVSFEGGFGANSSAPYSSEWHVGGLKFGHTDWLWRAAKGTPANYSGNYPADGGYDIGNSTVYAGGFVATLGRFVLWTHHGEFWKSGQTNKFQFLWDNGLHLITFGEVRMAGDSREARYGTAGNTTIGGMVKVGPDYYVYGNDEGEHGGVQRWKVSGVNSIVENRIPWVRLDGAWWLLLLLPSLWKGKKQGYSNYRRL